MIPLGILASSTRVTTDTAKDPHWDNVVALLQFETGMDDLKGYPWVFAGGYHLDPAKGAFGGQSLRLVNGYIASADEILNFMGGEFTYEIRLARSATGHCYPMTYGLNSSRKLAIGLPVYLWSNVGQAAIYTEEDIPRDEQFYHVEFSRALVSGSYRLLVFIDGVKVIDVPSTANILSTFRLYIGQTLYSPEGYGSHWIDSVRVTVGVARNTEDFTPPTEPFPNQ